MESVTTKSPIERELGDETFMSAAELGAYTDKLKVALGNKDMTAQDRAEKARAELIDQLSQTIEVTPEKVREVTRSLLHKLRVAAEQGKNELLVMRFPNVMCTDSGRAINNSEGDWPSTLTGRPRQAYEFWLDRLKSSGYGLGAMIVDWPDGMPGDVGLFLTWQKRHE